MTENKSKVPEWKLELILRITEGKKQYGVLLSALEFYPRKDDMYRWLLANGFTGKNLFWLFENCGFSHLQVAKFILSNLNKWKQEEIIYGKDIL